MLIQQVALTTESEEIGMKSLLPVVALVAAVAAATPALAQPLDITVRGGRILEDNAPRITPGATGQAQSSAQLAKRHSAPPFEN